MFSTFVGESRCRPHVGAHEKSRGGGGRGSGGQAGRNGFGDGLGARAAYVDALFGRDFKATRRGRRYLHRGGGGGGEGGRVSWFLSSCIGGVLRPLEGGVFLACVSERPQQLAGNTPPARIGETLQQSPGRSQQVVANKVLMLILTSGSVSKFLKMLLS